MVEKILEAKIAAAIHNLISSGVKPSQRKVIKLIGKGSLSTIGPVFNLLKDRFDNFTKLDDLCKHYQLKRHDPKVLFAENSKLKNQVATLEQHNFYLEEGMALLKEKLAKVTNQNFHLQKLYNELTGERDIILTQIKEEKDKQIASLLEELAATHKQHSKSFGDFTFSIDDKIIQKEVEIINLRSKITELNTKLRAYQADDMPQRKQLQHLVAENQRLVNNIYELEKKLAAVTDGK